MDVKLVLEDSIILHINKPVPAFCSAMFYFEQNNVKYLFVDDKDNKEIRIFNLNSRAEIDPIPIPGTDKISHYFGFVIKSLDSIYLPCADYQLICINRYGQIIKKIDFSDLKKSYPLLTMPMSLSRYTMGAVIIGTDIFFLQRDSRKFYFLQNPSGYRFLFRYNSKSDSCSLSPITLPEDFWDGGKREMSLFLTYNDLLNCFVFGSRFSDKIYTSNDGVQITNTYISKSESIEEYPILSPDNDSSQKNYIYYLCKYSYNVGLLWDSKNQVYYRFVWPGIKDLKPHQEEIIYTVYNSPRSFNIDLLDQNFQYVGSCLLSDKNYNWNNYFLTSDGLFLAENYSSDNSPETWTFHQYKIRNGL
jgi:hypothetical protein